MRKDLVAQNIKTISSVSDDHSHEQTLPNYTDLEMLKLSDIM